MQIISNDEHELLTTSQIELVESILQHAAQLEEVEEPSELSVTYLTNAEIHEVNREWRGKDAPTDVISFVASEGDNIGSDENYIGDIFINMDAVKRQAESYSHSRKREFCFLLAHGLLHCLGYDHQSKKEEEIMFDLQERILYEIAPRSTAATRQQI